MTISIIMALAGAVQPVTEAAVQPVPQAPPPVMTRVSPPVFTTPSERRAVPVVPVTLHVTLDNKTLWTGSINIGGVGQSRVSLSEPVPHPSDCDRPEMGRPGRQLELSISAQLYRASDAGEYRLSARYTRPVDNAGCGNGVRGISIDQSFSLEKGKPILFEGDGGLKVRLTGP